MKKVIKLKIMKKLKFLLLIIIAFSAISVFSQTFYEKENITKDTVILNEATVTASYKATKFIPFSFKNIESKTLDLIGREVEPAGLLQYTPSVTYNTDNGLFTGYSYYRIRGIDQTRINVTLNGVPMNEPEDQGIYFNNYGNFLQTISDVQIIRGAGVSKSGVSSYGGSINFDTNEPDKTKSEFLVSYGSYNTVNISYNVNLKKGWIRASFLQSDGYKYNSSNKSNSIFYGFNLAPNIKLYGFIGKQLNEMSWVGSSKESIKNNRRINANKSWEEDDFLYIHNQIHYNKNNINLVFYHTYLNGWYNMDFGHFDGNFKQTIYKLALESNWFGSNFNYNFKNDKWNTNLGVSLYTYYRDHNNLLGFPFDYESYNKNKGIRNELSPYFKTTYNYNGVKIYGDVQYRITSFNYNDPFKKLNHNWDFLNWSIGATHNLSNHLHTYVGIGKTHREPTRTDLFGGNDEYIEIDYNNIIPEEVIDYEVGFKIYHPNLFVNFNYYFMDFTNEIVLNGQYGPNSNVIHSNVAKSYRTGLELDIQYKYNDIEFKNVMNLSRNKITQDNTTITQVLSPSFVSVSDIIYHWKNNSIGLSLRCNGESFIDFKNKNKLPGYCILNLYSNINFDSFVMGIKINNIFDKLYYANGVIGFDGNPGYFQQAGFNFLISMKYKI